MSAEADILLVEDDKNYATLILMAIERRGWRERALRVQDGAEALDILASIAPYLAA